MENNMRAENRYLIASLFMIVGGSGGLLVGVAAHSLAVCTLGVLVLCIGLVCMFVYDSKREERIKSLPSPPPVLNSNSVPETQNCFIFNDGTQKTLVELEKWLEKDAGGVATTALVLLKVAKERIEAGGKLYFRDKYGFEQEIRIEYTNVNDKK